MLFSVILELRLEFGNPALGFLFINFSHLEFAGNFVKKSFVESFHPIPPFPPQHAGKTLESLGSLSLQSRRAFCSFLGKPRSQPTAEISWIDLKVTANAIETTKPFFFP